MHDSTTDITPGEGAFETGSSAADRVGRLEAAADSGNEHGTAIDGVEDRTAADVFEQLRDDADEGGADDILADESPDDIIASADDPDPETEAVDDALLADDGELTDLLLTGRSTDGEGEFRWIDTDAEASTAAGDSESASDAESTPAWEAGGTDLDDIFGGAVDDESTPDTDDASSDAEVSSADGEAGTEDPLENADDAPTSESDAENGADPDLADGPEETPTDPDDAPDAVPSLGTDDASTEETDDPTDDDGATAEDDGPEPDSDDSSGPLSRFRSALNGLF